MNAQEWDDCPRSDWMLLPLHEWLTANRDLSKAFDRKLRLFAVACCRHRWNLFDPHLFQLAVDAAERSAEGHANFRERSSLYDAIMALPTPDAQSHCIENMTLKLTGDSGLQAALAATHDLAIATGWDDFESVVRAQASLLRCIIGNLYRPVTCDPGWRTSEVAAIATRIHADRAFDRLPILADTLEAAGCEHPDVLRHCRVDTAHARGCWVVDMLLGAA